jgi:alkane 1-monooxygenase
MTSALPFFLIYLLPFMLLSGYIMGGWWNFLTPAVTFVFVPIADLIIRSFTINPPPEKEAELSASLPYRLITWSAAPVQVAMVVWGAYIVTHHQFSTVGLIGFVISVGIAGGAMGINISHELIHRRNDWEWFLGLSMLWTVGYMHWAIEHVSGHHKNVATPGDAATARYRESFYAFWPRTVIGTVKGSWGIEAARLERKKLPVMGLQNRILRYAVVTIIGVVALTVLWGPAVLPYWIVQSIFAISLLEVVNYLEHYGLLRKKLENGKYEKVTPIHSWNSAEMVTNLFLFNLQRHSDHHAEPGRRYQILRHQESAPQLPTGYAGMVMVAVIPPLWFRVMDRKVPEDMKKQATEARANIQ